MFELKSKPPICNPKLNQAFAGFGGLFWIFLFWSDLLSSLMNSGWWRSWSFRWAMHGLTILSFEIPNIDTLWSILYIFFFFNKKSCHNWFYETCHIYETICFCIFLRCTKNKGNSWYSDHWWPTVISVTSFDCNLLEIGTLIYFL